MLLLVLISSTAASKRKAKRTHSSPTHAEPEAAAVKGGSAYETNEYAKYEGDSKGERESCTFITSEIQRYFTDIVLL